MNEASFNKTLAKIAPDIRLLWNAQKRRWGIYQVRASHILLAGPNKPWLLWLCEERGEFRLPNQEDIAKVVHSTGSAHLLWEKGGNWYTDRIEEQEKVRADKVTADRRDLISQVTRSVKASANTVSTRDRRAHNIESVH